MEQCAKPSVAANILAAMSQGMVYHPVWNDITGGVLPSILLGQMMRIAREHDWKTFPMFKEPCAHAMYLSGGSWTEILGFTRREFDSALARIGTKITTGTSKTDVLLCERSSALILYWTDSDRITWYEVNVALVNKILAMQC